MRNNRCCPVCKRRVIPGDPDSENEDSDTRPNRNQTNSSIVEHEANEEEDTNEASRLLINNRNQSEAGTDDQSVCTTSTMLTTNQLQGNNETSSLNNQMTVSMNSAQLPLRSSSSKYGSISSINQISSSTNAYTNQACLDSASLVDENGGTTNKVYIPVNQSFIDSKASPDDYHTPRSMNSESGDYLRKGNPCTSSSPSVLLNLDSKNIQLKTVVKPQNKSKKSAKANSANVSQENKSIIKTKGKNSKKISPLNDKNELTSAPLPELIKNTSAVAETTVPDAAENAELYASCKEEFNLANDEVARVKLIQPSATNTTASNPAYSSDAENDDDDSMIPKIV